MGEDTNSMATEHGRVVNDRAGGADAPEPQASQPAGAHPSREVVERMIDLTAALASQICATLGHGCAMVPYHLIQDARSILRDLDPDKAIVDAVLAEQFPEAAEPNEWAMRKVAMACLARARSKRPTSYSEDHIHGND